MAETLYHCQGNRGIFGERNGIVVRLSPVTYIFSRHLFYQCSVIICNHGLEQLAHLGFQTMGPLSPHCCENEPYIKTKWGYGIPTPELSTGEDWNSILDACDRSPSCIASVCLRKAPPVPINDTCVVPQKLSGHCGEEKNIWPWALYPDVQRHDDNLTAHLHLVPRLRMRGAVPTCSYILTTCLLIKCRESGVFTFHLAELKRNIGHKFEVSGLSI